MILVLTVQYEKFLWHGGSIKHGHAGLQFNEFIPPGDLAGKDSTKIIHAEMQTFCHRRIYGERRKQSNLEIIISHETQRVVFWDSGAKHYSSPCPFPSLINSLLRNLG